MLKYAFLFITLVATSVFISTGKPLVLVGEALKTISPDPRVPEASLHDGLSLVTVQKGQSASLLFTPTRKVSDEPITMPASQSAANTQGKRILSKHKKGGEVKFEYEGGGTATTQTRLLNPPLFRYINPASVYIRIVRADGTEKNIQPKVDIHGMLKEPLAYAMQAGDSAFVSYEYGIYENKTYSLVVADRIQNNNNEIEDFAIQDDDVVDGSGELIVEGRKTQLRRARHGGDTASVSAAATSTSTTPQADAITITTSGAELFGSNKKIRGITIANNATTTSASIDTITLSWSGAAGPQIERIKIENMTVWDYQNTGTPTGKQNSGTGLDIADYTIPAGETVEIQEITFSSSVAARSFTLLLTMGDGSAKQATTSVLSMHAPFRLFASLFNTALAKDDDKKKDTEEKNETEEKKVEKEIKKEEKKTEQEEKKVEQKAKKETAQELRDKGIPIPLSTLPQFPKEQFFEVTTPSLQGPQTFRIFSDSSIELYQGVTLIATSTPQFEYQNSKGEWQPYRIKKVRADYAQTPDSVNITLQFSTIQDDMIIANYRFGTENGEDVTSQKYVIMQSYRIINTAQKQKETRVRSTHIGLPAPLATPGIWITAPDWRLHFNDTTGGIDELYSNAYENGTKNMVAKGKVLIAGAVETSPAASVSPVEIVENSTNRIKVRANGITYVFYFNGKIYAHDETGAELKLNLAESSPRLAFVSSGANYLLDIVDLNPSADLALGLRDDFQNPDTLVFTRGSSTGPFNPQNGAYPMRAIFQNGMDIAEFWMDGSQTKRYYPVFEVSNWTSKSLPAFYGEVDGVPMVSNIDYIVSFKDNRIATPENPATLVFQYLGVLSTRAFVYLDPEVGPSSPGTMETDSSYGNGAYLWSGGGSDAIADDSVLTTVGVGYINGVIPYYLKATNFGLSIPSNATITGVVVEVDKKCTNNSSTLYCKDYNVSLVKGGTIEGTNQAATSTKWGTTEAYATYGTSTDMWGISLTPDDVNASNFGFVVQPILYGGSPP